MVQGFRVGSPNHEAEIQFYLNFYFDRINKQELKMIPKYLISLMLIACAQQPPLALIPSRNLEVQKITLGSAQQIKVGMSGDEVFTLLSSPNIVTTDTQGLETWVYEKTFNESENITENKYNDTKISKKITISANSSRTLIVHIKFDIYKKVKTIQYRQSTY